MKITKVMSIKSQPNKVDIKKDYKMTNKSQEQTFGMKMNRRLVVGISIITGVLTLATIIGGDAIKKKKNENLNLVLNKINDSNIPDEQKVNFKLNIDYLALIERKNEAIAYGKEILDSVNGAKVMPNSNYGKLINMASNKVKMRQKMIAHRDSVIEACKKMFIKY